MDEPVRKSLLWNEQQFTAMLQSMVTSEAPSLFAVVQEYGDREDARIAAWGMAFAGHAEVVTVDGRLRMNVREPTNALRAFRIDTNIRARLVWFIPDAVTPGRGSTGVRSGEHGTEEGRVVLAAVPAT